MINVNEDLMSEDGNDSYKKEAGKLLSLAISRQNEIRNEYKNIGINLNPLIMIQLPNTSDDLLAEVEKYLDDNYAINYDNGRLARRLSGNNKGDLDNIIKYDSTIDALIFKEAGNVGWDCPRAKILVKLRTGMSENFEIQTIGRIRRMPFQEHYNNPLLDNSFLYTYDIKFTQAMIDDLDTKAYHNITIKLKPDISNIKLEKEYKIEDLIGFGERELFNTIYKYFNEKYKLNKNKKDNIDILKYNEYTMSTTIETLFYQGEIIDTTLESIKNSDIVKRKINIDLKIHNPDFMHAVKEISERIGLEFNRTKVILKKLFFKNDFYSKKILTLSKKDFYAFVINNEEKLKKDIDEAISQETEQLELKYPKTKWSIPEEDQVKISTFEITKIMKKNVMEKYPFVADKSRSELEFEKYVEDSDFFKWIYKNGESLKKHFSIVYGNKAKQKLFFPDYILLDKNNSIWIIETKGGEKKDHSDKNIDKDVKNKFIALKKYATNYKINFGFVRDSEVTGLLYFSNTEYADSLNNDCWIELDKIFI